MSKTIIVVETDGPEREYNAHQWNISCGELTIITSEDSQGVEVAAYAVNAWQSVRYGHAEVKSDECSTCGLNYPPAAVEG